MGPIFDVTFCIWCSCLVRYLRLILVLGSSVLQLNFPIMYLQEGVTRTEREKSVSPVELMLNAKFVRVGSFKGATIEPILVSKNGLSFFIEGKRKKVYKTHEGRMFLCAFKCFKKDMISDFLIEGKRKKSFMLKDRRTK